MTFLSVMTILENTKYKIEQDKYGNEFNKNRR